MSRGLLQDANCSPLPILHIGSAPRFSSFMQIAPVFFPGCDTAAVPSEASIFGNLVGFSMSWVFAQWLLSTGWSGVVVAGLGDGPLGKIDILLFAVVAVGLPSTHSGVIACPAPLTSFARASMGS